MRYVFNLCIYSLLVILVNQTFPLYGQKYVHHEIDILFQPEEHSLHVTDIITLPENTSPAEDNTTFTLHRGLQPVTTTPGVSIIRKDKKSNTQYSDMSANSTNQKEYLHLEDYQAILPAGVRRFEVKYQGEIHHPLQQGEVYARSFSETLGTISPQGIFLDGCTSWYPRFNDDLVTFTLQARVPYGWDVITQGERTLQTKEDTRMRTHWRSEEPQDEICLAGGTYTEYRRNTDEIHVMAFLRTPDETLANKYLETAIQYLSMYRCLIGPYPYKKFAVVENFWETGYGIASFTLLGPKVLRLPFILHSSYPHEILHNWWGNSVYVDYQTGNWCEGLTAYLADHLVQEQRGAGTEYRRTVLQKYTDYVAKGKDFPLTEFRTRHSSVTEAVGYGKALMFFHMLRRQIGDDVFIRVLQEFYHKNKYHRASFDDLRHIFTGVTGRDLHQEFDQWIFRPGAPILRVRDVSVQSDKKGYILSAVLEQVQPDQAYKLQVPVAITLEGHEYAYQTTQTMNDKRLELSLTLPSQPLRMDIDPEFDIFRKLDAYEIPPALSKTFGAEKALMILPSTAPEKLLQKYQDICKFRAESQSGKIITKLDNEIDKLPSDHAIWVLGWENRFLSQFISHAEDHHVVITNQQIDLNGKIIERANHSAVITIHHPDNPDLTLTLLASDSADAISGLTQSLPYYSKYSYLCFEGNEPNVIIKGTWPVLNSPMSIPIVLSGTQLKKEERGKLASRRPLAYQSPLFSGERMLQDVYFLAGETLQGRGFGTAELDMAAEYIAGQFRKAGIQPLGDTKDSFFQVWEDFGGEPERKATLRNVIGIIPGNNPKFADESVVVGAHYDHLGLGWPDVHREDMGKIHYGADDNTSGVAVLLEVARSLSSHWKPERTVIFIAFSGEESGLKGSKYYVTHQERFPVKKVIGMVNIDTVGRLGDNKLLILGTGSAKEWLYILKGISYTTGVPIEPIENDFGGSDQRSFLDSGIPAIQFFSGPNLDYHRPTDTVDKIEPSGMIKVAKVLKEVIEHLANRSQSLTPTVQKQDSQLSQNAPTPSPERKVTFGAIPDFAYTGNGFCLKGVIPNSPAEKAGFKAGDVIIRMNDTVINDLRSFSDLLKTLQPEKKVTITFLREEKLLTKEATVEGK